jgi:hypothetical protein
MAQVDITYLMWRHEQETAAATAASNRAARIAHSELAYRYSLAMCEAGAERCASGLIVAFEAEKSELKEIRLR